MNLDLHRNSVCIAHPVGVQGGSPTSVSQFPDEKLTSESNDNNDIDVTSS